MADQRREPGPGIRSPFQQSFKPSGGAGNEQALNPS